jgi:AcrR family transcriptional regulator
VTRHGATARGRETQLRIADALAALTGERASTPTARDIAARARVSLRLVFHYYEDLEALYRFALGRTASRHVGTIQPVDPHRPLDSRIKLTVGRWSRAYEEIGPMWRAATSMAPAMPSLAPGLERLDAVLATHLRFTFGPELGSDEHFEMLDAVLSFETWDRLRRQRRLSVARARRTVSYGLEVLLSAGEEFGADG